MIALPSEPGVLGIALLAGGLLLGALVGVPAFRRLRALFAGSRVARPAAALLAVATATAVGMAPFLAWRIVQDVRYTSRISRQVAERIVPYENYLDGAAFDLLAAAVPEGDTYFVDTSHEFGSDVFEGWTRIALLPRTSVSEPEDADWVITLGVDPRSYGLPLAEIREIPTSNADRAPTYLARVAR